MRVILFILGLLFSADGLYFASTTSMGVGEAFTVAIGIMFILWSTFYDAFKTKGFLKFIKGLFTFGMIVLVIRELYALSEKVTMRHTEKII